MTPAFKVPHECEHVGLEYRYVPGKGYWIHCVDCDTYAWGFNSGSNQLKAAFKEFDRKIEANLARMGGAA